MNRKIGDIISFHRKKNHMSQAELARRLEDFGIHIKNAAVSSWEKDINMPTAAQLLALCSIFGITNIYETFIGPDLSSPFYGLNEEGRSKILEYAKLLRLSGLFNEKETAVLSLPTRRMKVSLLSASAGTGDWLDEEHFEEIDVQGPVPQTADFGVYLNGDSMEPRFHNDELVWFEKTEEIKSGELGLFYLNGSTYFKEYKTGPSGTFLISLNTAYKPVSVGEFDSFRVFARLAESNPAF